MNRKNSFFAYARQALVMTLSLLLLCGLAYPVLLSAISAVIFPEQAKGSIIEQDGKAVGATFVGQEFTEDYFMKGRPSAYHYNTYTEDKDGNQFYNDGTEYAGLSSGSNNYAPSNPALAERVEADIDAFLKKNPTISREDIPTDLMTASGSGLDPHISPDATMIQIPAIAKSSGLSQDELREIVRQNTTGRLAGVFGEPVVNVLGVNCDIKAAMDAK